jgi:hypothetical protein
LETPSGVFHNVVRFQYYQCEAGELRIRVLPNSRFSDEDGSAILAIHRSKLGEEMDIVLELVDHIPLTPAGKQRWIIPEVNSASKPKAGNALLVS